MCDIGLWLPPSNSIHQRKEKEESEKDLNRFNWQYTKTHNVIVYKLAIISRVIAMRISIEGNESKPKDTDRNKLEMFAKMLKF